MERRLCCASECDPLCVSTLLKHACSWQKYYMCIHGYGGLCYCSRFSPSPVQEVGNSANYLCLPHRFSRNISTASCLSYLPVAGLLVYLVFRIRQSSRLDRWTSGRTLGVLYRYVLGHWWSWDCDSESRRLSNKHARRGAREGKNNSLERKKRSKTREYNNSGNEEGRGHIGGTPPSQTLALNKKVTAVRRKGLGKKSHAKRSMARHFRNKTWTIFYDAYFCCGTNTITETPQ